MTPGAFDAPVQLGRFGRMRAKVLYDEYEYRHGNQHAAAAGAILDASGEVVKIPKGNRTSYPRLKVAPAVLPPAMIS